MKIKTFLITFIITAVLLGCASAPAGDIETRILLSTLNNGGGYVIFTDAECPIQPDVVFTLFVVATGADLENMDTFGCYWFEDKTQVIAIWEHREAPIGYYLPGMKFNPDLIEFIIDTINEQVELRNLYDGPVVKSSL